MRVSKFLLLSDILTIFLVTSSNSTEVRVMEVRQTQLLLLNIHILQAVFEDKGIMNNNIFVELWNYLGTDFLPMKDGVDSAIGSAFVFRLYTAFGGRSLYEGCIMIGWFQVLVDVTIAAFMVIASAMYDGHFIDVRDRSWDWFIIVVIVFLLLPTNFILIVGTLKAKKAMLVTWIVVYSVVCIANAVWAYVSVYGIIGNPCIVITFSFFHLPPLLYMMFVVHSHCMELYENGTGNIDSLSAYPLYPQDLNTAKKFKKMNIPPPAYEDIYRGIHRENVNSDPPPYVAVAKRIDRMNQVKVDISDA